MEGEIGGRGIGSGISFVQDATPSLRGHVILDQNIIAASLAFTDIRKPPKSVISACMPCNIGVRSPPESSPLTERSSMSTRAWGWCRRF